MSGFLGTSETEAYWGGIIPTRWRAQVPEGVVLDEYTLLGDYSGVPTTVEDFVSLVSVVGSGVLTYFTIRFIIAPSPVPSIPDQSFSGTVGTLFSQQVSVTGTPTSWSATGLPPGLSINTATGLITGTPTATGTSLATVTATNVHGSDSQAIGFTVAVANATINATVGVVISEAFAGRLGVLIADYVGITGLPPGVIFGDGTEPYAPVVPSGYFPAWLYGIPTSAGTYTVTLTELEDGLPVYLTVVIVVAGSSEPENLVPSIPDQSFSGTVGTLFSQQVSVIGDPTSWSATGLPPGLSINTATGHVLGTPTLAETFSTTVQATNAYGTATEVIEFQIASPESTGGGEVAAGGTGSGCGGGGGIHPSIVAVGTFGGAADYTVLPEGLTFNQSTGRVSGDLPAGAHTIRVYAKNALGEAEKDVTFTASEPAAPTLEGLQALQALQGVSLNYQAAVTNPWETAEIRILDHVAYGNAGGDGFSRNVSGQGWQLIGGGGGGAGAVGEIGSLNYRGGYGGKGQEVTLAGVEYIFGGGGGGCYRYEGISRRGLGMDGGGNAGYYVSGDPLFSNGNGGTKGGGGGGGGNQLGLGGTGGKGLILIKVPDHVTPPEFYGPALGDLGGPAVFLLAGGNSIPGVTGNGYKVFHLYYAWAVISLTSISHPQFNYAMVSKDSSCYEIEVLMVGGGGGGGGGWQGGGGGGGEVVHFKAVVGGMDARYEMKIGRGGYGYGRGPDGVSFIPTGGAENGHYTAFGPISAKGGGGGKSEPPEYYVFPTTDRFPFSGGSGGGGSHGYTQVPVSAYNSPGMAADCRPALRSAPSVWPGTKVSSSTYEVITNLYTLQVSAHTTTRDIPVPWQVNVGENLCQITGEVTNMGSGDIGLLMELTAENVAGTATRVVPLQLTGTGSPSRDVRLFGNMSFGDVPTSGTATGRLVIWNATGASITVSSITYPTGFSGAFSGVIGAGNWAEVTVTFDPVAVTLYGGDITVNAGQSDGSGVIKCRGNGVI